MSRLEVSAVGHLVQTETLDEFWIAVDRLEFFLRVGADFGFCHIVAVARFPSGFPERREHADAVCQGLYRRLPDLLVVPEGLGSRLYGERGVIGINDRFGTETALCVAHQHDHGRGGTMAAPVHLHSTLRFELVINRRKSASRDRPRASPLHRYCGSSPRESF